MKNFNNLDSMLLKNKLNPSTSAVESNTLAIFSKRIHEEESSFYSEKTRNIKCQRKLNKSKEESNFISSFQDTDEIDENLINNSKGMDKNLPIFLLDDNDDAKISQPKMSKMYNINTINYIQSDHQNIIFPGYNKEVFTELFDFIFNKAPTDKLHSNRCCSCTMRDLINVFFPKLWMQDILIEHYFKHLAKNCKNELIVIFDSYFFVNFEKNGFEKATNSIKGPTKNVFDRDKVIIPTHLEGNHWTFTMVKIKSRFIHFYDSLKTNVYESEISLLADYLDIAYNKHKKPEDEEKIQWTLYCENSPLQTNDYDCGIFTCTNTRYVLLRKLLEYTQE
ncbi:uncharacterized protein LOC113558659 [Rhopalosiphum maidis]|uniref:uncharacterized protein LOC113558659 n=1 Tax=Rhopalosiphum maidis TaxID=43146 RepID=UPI000EFF0AA0|nr:uncharacterized protein LOC113558659 [Rhopalosiphum maidis]